MTIHLAATAFAQDRARPVASPSRETEDQLVDVMVSDLLCDRPKARFPLFQNVMRNARPNLEHEKPNPDAFLTDLFRFPSEAVPILDNRVSQTFGYILETLTRHLFHIAKPDLHARNPRLIEEMHRTYLELSDPPWKKSPHADIRERLPWKEPDFVLDDGRVLETKYNFASSQNRSHQIAIGDGYRKVGYIPIFLNFRPDFIRTEEFEKRGWIVHSGDAALDFLREETAIDIRRVLRRVSSHPSVVAIRKAEHGVMTARWAETMVSEFDAAPPFMRDRLLDHLVCHAPHRDALVRRLDGTDGKPSIRDSFLVEEGDPEDGFEDFDSTDLQEMFDIFEKQKRTKKTELLSRLIDGLPVEDRAALLRSLS